MEDATELLELAGCQKVFHTSAVTGEGTKELLEYIENGDYEE